MAETKMLRLKRDFDNETEEMRKINTRMTIIMKITRKSQHQYVPQSCKVRIGNHHELSQSYHILPSQRLKFWRGFLSDPLEVL